MKILSVASYIPFSLGNYERHGEIPRCIDLTMIPGDNTKYLKALRLKELIFMLL